MDGAETSAQADPQESTNIIIDDAESSDDDKSINEAQILEQNVHNATALGWAIAELLGRCFALPEEKPADIVWGGSSLVMLQETFTPRETIRALMKHILFVADSLDVSSIVIQHDGDPANNRRYIDVLQENVQQFTEIPAGPTADQARAQIRGKINERLFWWDLKIQDALQNRPVVIHKVYIVGRSLASLRWFFGLQDKILDDDFREKVCHEYVPMLEPYVSPFSTRALAYSLETWGKAISADQVKPGPDGPDGKVPPELQKQADIWYALATNERGSLTYVDPSVASRPYIMRVLRISWPVYVAGIILLVVVVALLLFVIFSHLNVIVTAVTAGAGFLAATGIAHSVMTSIGGILEKALSGNTLQKVEARATEGVKVSMIDSVWNSTQQQAVNKATCILPAGIDPKVAQKPQAKG